MNELRITWVYPKFFWNEVEEKFGRSPSRGLNRISLVKLNDPTTEGKRAQRGTERSGVSFSSPKIILPP